MDKTAYLTDLERAYELLWLDQKEFMPPEGQARRLKILETLKWVIDQNQPGFDGSAIRKINKGVGYLTGKFKNLIGGQQESYNNLLEIYAHFNRLTLANSVLSWLEQTEILGKPDAKYITDGQSAISVAKQALMEDPRMGQWIAETDIGKLDAVGKRNVQLISEKYKRATALDKEFVGTYSKVTSECYNQWAEAKKNNDFAAFLPSFEEVVKLTREKANILAKALGVTPYQALVGEANVALRTETIARTLGQLEVELPPLIKDVVLKQAAEPPPLPLPPIVDNDAILRAAKRVTKMLGLDESFSRLDQAPHPFSGGDIDDIRITIRKGNTNILQIIVGAIHEAGHAFYTRGLPRDLQDQPVAEAQSMWVHETQSLFWERQVLMTPEFMGVLSGILKEELNVSGPEWEADNLYKLITRVKTGLIRTESDELTYPIHVILRWKLEQQLIDGTLEPKDLPAAWQREMKEMLGVDVPSDKLGCMQDVHWPYGLFGDFPGYTFGAQGAAQLGEKIRQDIPDFKNLISKREFGPIRAWLTEHVHKYGSLYEGEELMQVATDKEFSSGSWFKQMKERFLGILEQIPWISRDEITGRGTGMAPAR